ncbi:DUF6308 family protein [Streptomyces sp. NPDC054933]
MGRLPHSDFTERLRVLLSEPQAIADLKRYFAIDLPQGSALPFTGARFEHLDGGGDTSDKANTITASDLIAVQMLSVRVPRPATLALLEGDLGRQLTPLLAKIPTNTDMAKVDIDVLTPNSPADQAWHLLKRQTGLGWVTTNKLLARKRPRLLPVYDEVVRCAVGHPRSFWLSLHQALTANGGELHEHLLQLRTSAGVSDTVSTLRVCDVVVWMRHADSHQGRDRPGPFV